MAVSLMRMREKFTRSKNCVFWNKMEGKLVISF